MSMNLVLECVTGSLSEVRELSVVVAEGQHARGGLRLFDGGSDFDDDYNDEVFEEDDLEDDEFDDEFDDNETSAVQRASSSANRLALIPDDFSQLGFWGRLRLLFSTARKIFFGGGDDDGRDLADLTDLPEDFGLMLEKSWHGLHYLLSGETWGGEGPRAFLLHGGLERGEDMGYGPTRYFSPDEVTAIAAELSEISDDELWSSYNAEEMSADDVYPNIWDEPEDDLREEYLMYFNQLKQFLAQSAERGEGLKVYLT